MKLDVHELPHVVAGSCLEVHRHLGPGLDFSCYKACLAHELRMREIMFRLDAPMTINYKGMEVAGGATLDFVVEDLIVIQVLAVEALLPVHKEVLKNHLRLTGFETGFLVNFNVSHLRENGLKRIIVSSSEPKLPFTKAEGPVYADGGDGD